MKHNISLIWCLFDGRKGIDVTVTANPFQDDFYRKAVYHQNREEPPKMRKIKENPVKEKSRALAVIQDDEGFNWNDFIPNDEQISSAFVADIKPGTFNREREIAHEGPLDVYGSSQNRLSNQECGILLIRISRKRVGTEISNHFQTGSLLINYQADYNQSRSLINPNFVQDLSLTKFYLSQLFWLINLNPNV